MNNLLKPTETTAEKYGYHEPKWRMSAYYYGFEPTGLAVIDKILSAVACAGKQYHHTENWENEISPYDHLTGETPVECIQNAANDAAAEIRAAVPPPSPWQPIETAPKDGTEVIVFHPEAGVCAAFSPKEGFAWHCMDGSNTVVGSKSGVSIPRMTSFLSAPTHWMPLPAAPVSGGGES